jgi:hypothetical protein
MYCRNARTFQDEILQAQRTWSIGGTGVVMGKHAQGLLINERLANPGFENFSKGYEALRSSYRRRAAQIMSGLLPDYVRNVHGCERESRHQYLKLGFL